MTPYQLDALACGAKVYIYRRPDASVYATVHDFTRFGVDPVETVRVPLSATSTVTSVEGDAKVLAALKRHRDHHQ